MREFELAETLFDKALLIFEMHKNIDNPTILLIGEMTELLANIKYNKSETESAKVLLLKVVK